MIQLSTNLIELKEQVVTGQVPAAVALDSLINFLRCCEVSSSHLEVPVEETGDTLMIGDDKIKLDYEAQLGGNAFLVENLEDLKEIEGCTGPESPKEAESHTLFDGAYIFDVVEIIMYGASSDAYGYICVALMTNNAGGNSYYIPPKFMEECPYIGMAIDAQRASDEKISRSL